MQVSGLSYIYTKADNPTDEVPYKVAKVMTADGNELDPNATYTLVINDFLYGGGDGFSIFRDAKLVGAINPDTEVFVEYLSDLEKAGQTISAAIDGRKTFVENYVDEPVVKEPEVDKPVEEPTVEEPQVDEDKLPSEDMKTPEKPEKLPADKTPAPVALVAVTAETAKPVVSTSQKTLPNTGQSEFTSLLISLGGLVSLGMAVALKRKEHQ